MREKSQSNNNRAAVSVGVELLLCQRSNRAVFDALLTSLTSRISVMPLQPAESQHKWPMRKDLDKIILSYMQMGELCLGVNGKPDLIQYGIWTHKRKAIPSTQNKQHSTQK